MGKIFSTQSLRYFLSGLGMLLLFVGFSYLVHKGLFIHLDFNTTVRLQDHISRRFDAPFSLLSEFGSFEPMLIVLIVLLIIRRKIVLGFFSVCFFGAMHLAEIFGKSFVSHLPPPQFMLRTEQIINFPQFYVRLQNSYPSGHAGRALFVTVFLGMWVSGSRRFSWGNKLLIITILSIYDITMLISRIYLGEHWLSDVIGGSLLGCAMAFFTGIFV